MTLVSKLLTTETCGPEFNPQNPHEKSRDDGILTTLILRRRGAKWTPDACQLADLVS